MRIGVDVGGTKIEAVALDDTGNVLRRARIPTPVNAYRATLKAIARIVASIESNLGATGSVGVGAPGALSPDTGLLKNSNSVCLNGKPLLADLQELLARPVRMANDANCFALSEATDGAAAGATVVFAVIVGTGAGAGVVVDGRVLTGPNAIAGEWGHNPLPWPQDTERPGRDCYCGQRGCIETWLSGPGLAYDHKLVVGEERTAPQIVDCANDGEENAEATMRRYEDRLARSLAHVINILDPDVIVLGGGMSNIRRLYRSVPHLWTRYVFSDRVNTPLRPPMHGDSSGVRGAAWLWDV